MNRLEDKMFGCLYGQAIGDALGLGTEFMNKENVSEHYPDGLWHYNQIIRDNHRRRWPVGAWTDDTDMMLCILNGFENGRFNINRVACNFKDWFDGTPMGIGSHTYKVLCMGDFTTQPYMCSRLWWELSQKESAANGALMRTSVIGLAPNDVEEQAVSICRLTHYDPRCIGSCVIVSLIIHNLIRNNRELSYHEIQDIARKYDSRISEWVEKAFYSTDISALELDEPYSIGYTLRALAAALWCYWHAPAFETGLIKVVNEGGDADTNAAIACAVLGAKFGLSDIPEEYVVNLYNREFYHKTISEFINKINMSDFPLRKTPE